MRGSEAGFSAADAARCRRRPLQMPPSRPLPVLSCDQLRDGGPGVPWGSGTCFLLLYVVRSKRLRIFGLYWKEELLSEDKVFMAEGSKSRNRISMPPGRFLWHASRRSHRGASGSRSSRPCAGGRLSFAPSPLFSCNFFTAKGCDISVFKVFI